MGVSVLVLLYQQGQISKIDEENDCKKINLHCLPLPG